MSAVLDVPNHLPTLVVRHCYRWRRFRSRLSAAASTSRAAPSALPSSSAHSQRARSYRQRAPTRRRCCAALGRTRRVPRRHRRGPHHGHALAVLDAGETVHICTSPTPRVVRSIWPLRPEPPRPTPEPPLASTSSRRR